MAIESTLITEQLLDYIHAHEQAEPPLLRQFREQAETLEHANWRSSANQARFIAMMLQVAGAQQCIEVGTFVGYSSLWMALALPANGSLVTIDLTDEYPAIGRPYWQQAGVEERIDLRIGPATEVLAGLLDEQGNNSFDLAFIDANKKEYLDYYEACIDLVRPGGLLLVDNVLWGGRVIDDNDEDKSTVTIRKLNDRIRDDDRVDAVMLPFNDGLTIARKR